MIRRTVSPTIVGCVTGIRQGKVWGGGVNSIAKRVTCNIPRLQWITGWTAVVLIYGRPVTRYGGLISAIVIRPTGSSPAKTENTPSRAPNRHKHFCQDIMSDCADSQTDLDGFLLPNDKYTRAPDNHRTLQRQPLDGGRLKASITS
jgi:hypothetical protein